MLIINELKENSQCDVLSVDITFLRKVQPAGTRDRRFHAGCAHHRIIDLTRKRDCSLTISTCIDHCWTYHQTFPELDFQMVAD
jgi:hypothetical protein